MGLDVGAIGSVSLFGFGSGWTLTIWLLVIIFIKYFQFGFGCPGWRFFNSPTIGNTFSLPAINTTTMGLFNLFKKPTIVQDNFFGELRYMDLKDETKGYFEGKGLFAPTKVETEYFIEADKSGPTDEQKEFYKDLQHNFEQYTQKLKPLIEDEFRNWKENFEIKDFNKEFTLVSVTIPRLNLSPITWDMAFTTVHDENHHVSIDFVDKEPVNVLIDG